MHLRVALLVLVALGCTKEPRKSPQTLKTPTRRETGYANAGARAAVETALRVFARCSDGAAGYGSAVRVGPRLALTARHVGAANCPDGSEPMFLVMTASGEVAPARLLVASSKADGALLEVPDSLETEVARIRESWAPIGSRAWSCGGHRAWVGNPADSFTLKVGYVAGYQDEHVKVSGHVVRGNSGGGVFDDEGYLIGIVSLGSFDPEDENYGLMVRPDALGDLRLR